MVEKTRFFSKMTPKLQAESTGEIIRKMNHRNIKFSRLLSKINEQKISFRTEKVTGHPGIGVDTEISLF